MPIKDWHIAEKANLPAVGQVKRSSRSYNTLREQLVSVKTNLSRSARLRRSQNPCVDGHLKKLRTARSRLYMF